MEDIGTAAGVDALRARLAVASARFDAGFEGRAGCPPSGGEVLPATAAETGSVLTAHFGAGRVPDDVVGFFEGVSVLSLPDLWNGYFVGPPSWIVSLARAGEPSSVEDADGRYDVLVVGTDGGGRLFVVRCGRSSPVYALEEPAIYDGVVTVRRGRRLADVEVAPTFEAFVGRIATTLEAAARGGPLDPP